MLSIGAFGGQFWSSSFPLGRTTLTGAPAIELTLDMRSSCPPVVARLWFASVLSLLRLHFAEGSVMMPLLVHLLSMLTGGLPDGLKDFIAPDIEKTLK